MRLHLRPSTGSLHVYSTDKYCTGILDTQGANEITFNFSIDVELEIIPPNARTHAHRAVK